MIELKKIPFHLGIIPDGNRRWARKNNLPIWKGHYEGYKRLKEIVEYCFEIGIKEISVYVLSHDNFKKRDKKEVAKILQLMEKLAKEWEKKNSWIKKLSEKHDVKITFCGNLNQLPQHLIKKLKKIEKETRNRKNKLNLLVCYSGILEVISALKKMKRKKKVNEESLFNSLCVKKQVDLIIRTGGYSRLSNFLPLQSTYAEIYVTKKLWPEFTKEDLIKALKWYSKIKRKFGK